MLDICIVGNSGNLLDKELGEKIDSCDHVLRIQKFKTRGFEKHVGSKTTIACLSWRCVDQMNDFISYGNIDLEASKLWSVHPLAGFRLSCVEHILGHSNIHQPTKELYNRLVENLYSTFWRKIPSSGIVTIEMALGYFEGSDIYICGFDNTIEKDHYYDPSHIDYLSQGMTVSGHNWEKEWEYIQRLIDLEKIYDVCDKNE